MGQNEISQASQAAYEAEMAKRQVDDAVLEECDRDLSPKERKEREEFDAARARHYTGKWPAGQK